MSQINAIVSKRLQIYRYFVENEKMQLWVRDFKHIEILMIIKKNAWV